MYVSNGTLASMPSVDVRISAGLADRVRSAPLPMLATKPSHPVLSLPKFLLDWPTWAAWTAPIKRPLDLRRNLRAASVTDPDSWAPFRYAEDYLTKAARLAPPSLPLDCGVGILVAPPLVFVDLDDIAPDPQDLSDDDTSAGSPDDPADRPPWVDEFLQRVADIGAYTEWSGSATGAHALVRTSPGFPSLTRNRFTRSGVAGPVGIEVYSSARFAALTGFPFFDSARPLLNDPRAGDALLTAFIADLSVKGAPVLSPLVLGPIHVPRPTSQVQRLAAELAALPVIDRAFSRPQEEFTRWSADRVRRSLDSSLSAWRFYLYGAAARHSPVSPLPLYELFNPSATTPQGALAPAHPNVAEWQEVSGYLRKRHRLYADIQRAHALVVEEQRLLALDLGEPPPPVARPAPRPPDTDLAESWAQLGLVLHHSKNSTAPLPSSVNFIRVLTKHSHFQQYKIERNSLDGTTRVNRQPLPDTLATRFLEPVRVILGMHSDPPIQAIRDAIEVVADDNAYDPLKEYLLSLPPFSPSESPSYLSTWLERIGAAPDADLARYSRRILLGLVARALRPGCKFDYVPVFEGPTGIGKSTLVELLVSRPFHAVLSTDLHSKDARIAIRGKWGVELAEMSAFKKSDEESRKSFFSTAADTFRPPYGRASIDVARRCVLFGTTEDKQYLTDHRGNRRYWPIYFSRELDLKWFADNRDALFAEAKYHFDLGERFHDTTDEMLAPERLSALEERLLTPAWHQRIIDHLLSLPRPHLPPSLLDSDADTNNTGFSGVLTVQYVANLHRVLDLPPALMHMSDAQLAAFLRRAGYHPRTLAYRTPDKQSVKTYVWVHPALRLLTDEQFRAFVSFFPAIFRGGEAPLAWVMYRVDHLPGALQHLGRAE